MLQVWLFFRDGRLAPNPQYAGKHRGVLYHNGAIDLGRFLQDQLETHSEKDKGNVLVTGDICVVFERGVKLTVGIVSANQQIRDHERDLIQVYLHTGVKLLELDYQPVERRRSWWPFTWSRR